MGILLLMSLHVKNLILGNDLIIKYDLVILPYDGEMGKGEFGYYLFE